MKNLTADQIKAINSSRFGSGECDAQTLNEVLDDVEAGGDVHVGAAILCSALMGGDVFSRGNIQTAIMAVYAFYAENDYLVTAEPAELRNDIEDILRRFAMVVDRQTRLVFGRLCELLERSVDPLPTLGDADLKDLLGG